MGFGVRDLRWVLKKLNASLYYDIAVEGWMLTCAALKSVNPIRPHGANPNNAADGEAGV